MLTQAEEEERFENEVKKRRTRIGAAGPEAVRREVGLEMFGASEVGILRLKLWDLMMILGVASCFV